MKGTLGTACSLFLAVVMLAPGAFAQRTQLKPTVITSARHDQSSALGMMRPAPIPQRDGPYIVPNKFHKFGKLGPAPDKAGFVDPALQVDGAFSRASGSVLTDFDGLNDQDNAAILGYRVVPPDTDGDVGPNHYVQWVNSVVEIFNKNGGTVQGPFAGNQFWAGFGDRCESENDGDPIVLYDHLADRWLMSQFVASSPYALCFAISQTGDPTGAYNRYQFNFSSFPDYFKVGVWNDAYYVTTRNFGRRFFEGQFAVALERSKMLTGQSAQAVIFDIPGGTGIDGYLPADLDGPAPPAGVGGLFTAVPRSGSSNTIKIFEMDVNWSSPNSSTFSQVGNIGTQTFDTSISTVPQPNGQGLDALTNFTMFRAAYRNFNGQQRMVLNHTVDVGNNRAGVRWYEVRSTGGSWSMYQQGTYAPSDGLHRWMGSIAMNANGDIALGYSVSGTSLFPSIRFTGQTADQSGSGLMNVDETTIKAGAGSQESNSRWGDYASMSVDPSDNTTFWFTTEYYATTSSFNFNTRIAHIDLGGTSTPGNTAPTVSISAPANGTTFTEGDAVTFTGSASDTEDGNLSSSIAWSSSINGALGSGSSITTSNLSVGTHTITASATDSGGLTGSASRSVTIQSAGGGGDPTTMTVSSVVTGTQNAGQGNKNGTATVTVVNNQGGAVSNATVTVNFGAPYSQTRSGTTGANGTVTVVTTTTARGGSASSFTACVTNVTHATLTWSQSGSACSAGPVIAGAETEGTLSASAGVGIPDELVLEANFPNPFRRSTLVGYGLPEDARVSLRIVDMLGREVAVLVDDVQEAGYHRAAFNADLLSPGLYIAVIQVNGVTQVQRMTLLR